MIGRPPVLLSLIPLLLLCPVTLRAQATTPSYLQDALALEQVMQKAIREAEPAVACVLVSRSDVYRKWFGDIPPREFSGRLGAFDPERAQFVRVPPEDRFQVEEMRREIQKKMPKV